MLLLRWPWTNCGVHEAPGAGGRFGFRAGRSISIAVASKVPALGFWQKQEHDDYDIRTRFRE